MSSGHDSESSPTLEEWEYLLVRSVAARIRTTEREDLESVLAIHLLEIKRRFGDTARNWRALAATILRNKASNWIRDRQLATSRLTALDEARDDAPFSTALLQTPSASEPDPMLHTAVLLVRQELGAHLSLVWDALIESDGNQVEVGRRFGVHRNTVRLWIRKIRDVLMRHGIDSSP